MKKINVRFEQDKTLDSIDIVIRADERDAQVTDLMESLARYKSFRLIALDQNGCPSVINESEIMSRSFLRVSRFEIINLKMVRKYDFTIGGTLRIEFQDGMETWASRRFIPLIKERLSREEGYLC